MFIILRVVCFGKNVWVLFFLLFNMFFFIFFVGINVILSYNFSYGENLGYFFIICYIVEFSMVLYIFVLFVGIVVCFNMFMFLVMVSRI